MTGISGGSLITLLGMALLCGAAAWGVLWVIRHIMWRRNRTLEGQTFRVLETCHVAYDRQVMLFTCPFGQGLLLLSPKGDQVILFSSKTDDASPPPYAVS